MDRACILLLLAVGLLAISAANATQYVGGWPCPAFECNEPPPVGNGLCPTVSCSSTFVTAASGPRGCAFVSTHMGSKAVSRSAYVADTKLKEQWEDYCGPDGEPKAKLGMFTKSVAEAIAISTASALVKYHSYWCTCRRQSVVVSFADGQAAATAQSIADVFTEAILGVKEVTCSDPMFHDKVIAYAAADAGAIASDVKLAIAALQRDYMKFNKNTCDSYFAKDYKKVVAKAIACAVSRAVIKTYNDLGEDYEYSKETALTCANALAATASYFDDGYYACPDLSCKW